MAQKFKMPWLGVKFCFRKAYPNSYSCESSSAYNLQLPFPQKHLFFFCSLFSAILLSYLAF